MKRVLAALLTGTMVVAMGCVAVQTEEVDKNEVDKNETIVVYTNNAEKDESSGWLIGSRGRLQRTGGSWRRIGDYPASDRREEQSSL